MSKIATLTIDGNQFELPVITGSENEGAIDISKLRDASGLITLDPGYKNSGSCKSGITFLDGELGILRYRGYAIEDLAEKSNFLEVSYLIIFGELPTAAQLHQFEEDIRKYTLVNEEMKNIIDGFPKTAHPMGVLSALTSALTAFNPKSVNVDNSAEMYEAVCKTMGKFLVIATWTYRKSMGFPLNYYDNTKGYVENFMRLMFELPTGPYAANPVVINALDKLFILHADHEQNCSTSTVRMVGSSHAGLFASISAVQAGEISMNDARDGISKFFQQSNGILSSASGFLQLGLPVPTTYNVSMSKLVSATGGQSSSWGPLALHSEALRLISQGAPSEEERALRRDPVVDLSNPTDVTTVLSVAASKKRAETILKQAQEKN